MRAHGPTESNRLRRLAVKGCSRIRHFKRTGKKRYYCRIPAKHVPGRRREVARQADAAGRSLLGIPERRYTRHWLAQIGDEEAGQIVEIGAQDELRLQRIKAADPLGFFDYRDAELWVRVDQRPTELVTTVLHELRHCWQGAGYSGDAEADAREFTDEWALPVWKDIQDGTDFCTQTL